MAVWIVRTKGEYPFLLPFLVDDVLSRKQLAPDLMEWTVTMTDQEAEQIQKRGFVESLRLAESAVS